MLFSLNVYRFSGFRVLGQGFGFRASATYFKVFRAIDVNCLGIRVFMVKHIRFTV